MQAKVKKERDAFVIHLSGKVDFDSSEPFRSTLMNHIKGTNVVFNMKELDFVGSNGITPFVQTIKELCSGSVGIVRFCHLSSEFVRIFEANDIPFGVNFQDEFSAIDSLFTPVEAPMPDFQESVRPEAVVAVDPSFSAGSTLSRPEVGQSQAQSIDKIPSVVSEEPFITGLGVIADDSSESIPE
ncbi:MAG: STAS domain-containing protein [Pseudomonadota bacterium]